MFAKERQNIIFSMIKDNGAVTTARLVESFGVSIETIRRDLLQMEQQGQLLRVHGGAVEKGTMKVCLELKERNKEYGVQKQNLSSKAMEFIQEGDVICIDEGSTAISLSEALRERFTKLTVVTHSLDVFNILCNHREFEVILCGGHFMRTENAFFGPLVLDTLNTLHVKKAFIFPSAVSLEYGICDFHQDLYQVQNAMIKAADEIYILADSSKFERNALLKLDDMKDTYSYITDSDLPEELRSLYKENNIKIYTGGI
ncbi:MAG: DeoR/GlpR transcriptional regulator [Clostridia bacterium]|nr:DeoR/GlpR transcriptional regulator [Clostridia bacterium]